MDFGARDIISTLPNALICHILSFLPTKEAASTSVLSKSWRFLFAFATILDFDDSIYLQSRVDKQLRYATQTSFMDFVDRVLALQGNSTINKISLKCTGYVDDLVRVTGWIINVLGRGVRDLDLSLLELYYPFPPKVFVSTTLVKLKLRHLSFTIGVEDVFLPNLKTLYLVDVVFQEDEIGFAKLLSGCPVLEELVMMDICWEDWKFCAVSITTLKRLTVIAEDNEFLNPKSVSFDTPNLSYLEYSDNIANKYPKLNFDSLVEASICLRLTETQSENAFIEGGDYFSGEMVGNATNFLMAIRNVQFLCLSDDTLKVLTYCCQKTPVFNNLIQLTVESVSVVRHKSFPSLLKNCPNLETLVFKNIRYKHQERLYSFLSSSPVKVLKISLSEYDNDDVIRLFLEKMPRLEQLIVYYNTSYGHNVFELSKKLQRIPRIASPKCKIQVISENLRLSCTLPSSSEKWSAPPKVEYSWLRL